MAARLAMLEQDQQRLKPLQAMVPETVRNGEQMQERIQEGLNLLDHLPSHVRAAALLARQASLEQAVTTHGDAVGRLEERMDDSELRHDQLEGQVRGTRVRSFTQRVRGLFSARARR